MSAYWPAILVLALCSPLLAAEPGPGPTQAQEQDAASKAESEAKDPASLLSLEGSIDFTHEYIFRGYKQHAGGVIIQPSLTLSLNLPELQNDDFSLTPYIGTWNSTSTVNNSPHSPKWFFETDTYAGIRLAVDHWEFDLYYQYAAYPGGVWTSTNEVDLTLSYDDSWYTQEKLGLPFSIQPHIGIGQELNRSDNIEDGTTGTYLELGIAPEFEVPVAGTPITLTLPTTLGFSAANYYLDNEGNNRCFGYVSTGLQAELPLDFLVGRDLGEWSLVGTVTYTRMNAETTIDANDGKRDAIVGGLSLRFSF